MGMNVGAMPNLHTHKAPFCENAHSRTGKMQLPWPGTPERRAYSGGRLRKNSIAWVMLATSITRIWRATERAAA